MTFTTLRVANKQGSLVVSVPIQAAEMLGWKEGTTIWIDWLRIAKETSEIETSYSSPKHTTDKRYEGEINHGTREEQTSRNDSSRSSKSNNLGERSRNEKREANNAHSEPVTNLHGQGQEMAGNAELEPERPTKGDSGTTASIPDSSNERERRIKQFF